MPAFDGPLPTKARKALVADLFCGAGGSSTGARRALKARGVEMVLTAVNHWPVAIETHQRNHPDARHYCTDLEAAKPEELVPEGKLDLLMASPTCTFHSRARGGKPTSDQQRMDPWHVVRWATTLRVKRLIVENVPEFVDWGPVDLRNGRPIKSRRGEYFEGWLGALRAIGFKVEWRVLNAADYGDATTRKRFFLLARSDGKPLRWPDASHSRDGGSDLFGGGRKWKAAREVIDWSIEGRSIFGRKKPLSPKTLARIHAGAMKLGWPQPFLVILRNHMAAQGLDLPLPAITAGGTHIGLAEPFTIANRTNNVAQRIDGPVPTIVTSGSVALVEPFVLSQASGGAERPVSEPVPTIPCGGAHALISPYYGSGSGESCASVEQPLPTCTTKARFGMVVPVTHGGGHERSHSLEDPLPTLTCARRGELAFITAAFGERDGQAPRTHDIGAPVPAICAQGRINLVEPLVLGQGSNTPAKSPDEPLPAIVTVARVALVEPALVNMKGRSTASSAESPMPTITGHARHLAIAETTPDGGYDIRFRMLEPRELARAMGFDDGEVAYEFAGNKTEMTRQIGNAVPVNTAAALVGAMFEEGR